MIYSKRVMFISENESRAKYKARILKALDKAEIRYELVPGKGSGHNLMVTENDYPKAHKIAWDVPLE